MPTISSKTYIAQDAVVVGEVTVGDDCSIFYHAVLRGDTAEISIGNGTNIQDNVVVHCSAGCPTKIGEGTTVGHSAVVHGCTVGSNTIIGMGAVILDKAVIGDNCIIGAGSLVPGGTVVPDGSVAFGNPVKIRRAMTEDDIENNRLSHLEYIELGKSHFGA